MAIESKEVKPPPLSLDEAMSVCLLDYNETGIVFYLKLYEDPVGASREGMSFITAKTNEIFTYEEISDTYGPGKYRIFITRPTDGKVATTSIFFEVSQKSVQAKQAKEPAKEPERQFSINDMRAMIALLKEFNEVVLSHNPSGTHQPAQIEMMKQANEMMKENMRIASEQQKQTFEVILEQSKIREKAVIQNIQNQAEDDMYDDSEDLGPVEPGQPGVVDLRSPTEKLVDDTFNMAAEFIPQIVAGGPVGAFLANEAKKHPLFAQVTADGTALQLLAYRIWEQFGREQMVTVVNSLGLPSTLIDAVALLIEGIKAAT